MPDTTDRESPVEVFLELSGVDGQGLFDGTGVTVRSGSRGRSELVPSASERMRRRRDELLAQDVIGQIGEHIVFNRDYRFSTPSGAAAVLVGGHRNGWNAWKTADGLMLDALRSTPSEAREVSFRRRWYEAHVDRFGSDPAAMAEGARRQSDFAGSAEEALGLLSTLETSRDVAAFSNGLQQWAVKPTTLAFNGFSGQMLVNQLVKRSEGSTELADVFADTLRAPGDLADARRKIQRLVDHVESIRVGAHPAPGHAPFLLSYFWSLQDHSTWPTIWSSAASFAEFCTGQSLPSVPADRYEQFCAIVESVDDDCERFEAVAVWWDEAKPVLLDPVLVDRCEFGWEPDDVDLDARYANADALVTVARYIGTTLADELSSVIGRSLAPKPAGRMWNTDFPRSDVWVDWRAHESGLGLRLWIGKIGATIGLTPGQQGAGWSDEVSALINASPVEGFAMIGGRGRPIDGLPAHGSGRPGEFTYARFFERDELGELDVTAELVSVAVALQPLLDRLSAMASGAPIDADADDPLRPFVERFQAEVPPTAADQEQYADRERFADLLAADKIALADPAEMRLIWNTGRYGGPGVMPALNRTFRDADAAEHDRIVDAFRYLCWGEDADAQRIDRLLTDPEYKVAGLGESVIVKMLAICHPQRYLPVFPYSGPKGKRVALAALDLPEPTGSRGELQVQSNDAIRARLDPFFPNDPWRMMMFVYWFIDGGKDGGDPGGQSEVDVLDELATELLVDRKFLADIVSLIEDKGQVIFYGPPGTGKTYLARKLAETLAPDATRRSLVQFHPSTSYEDFFEGYRPEDNDDGGMSYRLTRGPLALIAQRAVGAPAKRHVMVIDELNRANLPRVFGELLFLLEYRNESVRTLYRPEDAFELPSNLWFIGTMNTADRSIALVDAALRRRFHFIPFFPNHGPMKGLLERWLEREGEPKWVGDLVAKVNDQLEKDLGGPHLQIGPSHFMKPGLDREAVRRIWEYNIEPFIEDQFFGDPQRMETYRFDRVLASYLHDDMIVGSLEELEAARSTDEGLQPPAPASSDDVVSDVEPDDEPDDDVDAVPADD